MYITGLRAGFAFNSSSTHSIVVLDPNYKNKDRIEEPEYYGWEYFLCGTKEVKRHYFASQLYTRLCRTYPTNISGIIVQHIYGIDNPITVDHQSVICIPTKYGTDEAPDLSFFKEFSDYFIDNPDFGISGGNDNGDDDFIWYGTKAHVYPLEDSLRIQGYSADTEKIVSRRESDGRYTIFSPYTGLRMRLSNEFVPVGQWKSSTPELVDIKITSYCDNKLPCAKWCYQSSNSKGMPAEMHSIYRIAKALEELQVFEVALGGGEPTSHPEFRRIIECFGYSKIVPNFTTGTVDWTIDDSLLRCVERLCGSFAVSIINYRDFLRKKEVIDSLSETIQRKCYYQITDRTWSLEDVILLIADYNDKKRKTFKLSIVGFKDFGNGFGFLNAGSNGYDFDLWKLLQDHKFYGLVHVDTAFLSGREDVALQNRCDTQEGLTSMYIDCVENTMNISSFSSTPAVPITKEKEREEILNYFTRI